jgi:hypothetical protein
MIWPFESSEPFDGPAQGSEFQRWMMNMGRAGSGLG